MAVEPSLFNAALTMVFGALAGGITNAVAIWMLFHPYEPRGLGRLKLQGAIPKNKARLSKTVGRTVGQRLLTSEDITSHLASPGLREAFQQAVRGLVGAVLEKERDSLRSELPEPLRVEIESALDAIAPTVAARLVEFTQTEAFREAVKGFLEHTSHDIAERPVGEVLTEARRIAIRDRVEQWVADAVASAELEQRVSAWLDRRIEGLAKDRTPLLDRLPPGLIAAVEQAIAGYIPLALDRLTRVLHDPAARDRIQRSLHDLFDRFVKDLLLHERIVAKLVVTERTIARMLDNFERDGVDDLTRLLDEPEMRTQVAQGVNEAVVNFLRRSLAEHIDTLGPDRVAGIRDTMSSYIIDMIRDPTTRSYAIEKLDQSLQSFERRTWGELLSHLPPERTADWLAESINSQRVRSWVQDGTALALNAMLDRPLGRPADLLPERSIERITTAVDPVLWNWMQRQVPVVVKQIDVAHMVEEKVSGFSLERIEQLVRSTTQRELDLIVRLGYVLGAVVGATAYGVSLLLP